MVLSRSSFYQASYLFDSASPLFAVVSVVALEPPYDPELRDRVLWMRVTHIYQQAILAKNTRLGKRIGLLDRARGDVPPTPLSLFCMYPT